VFKLQNITSPAFEISQLYCEHCQTEYISNKTFSHNHGRLDPVRGYARMFCRLHMFTLTMFTIQLTDFKRRTCNIL